MIPSLRKGESLSIYLQEQTEKKIFLSDLQKGQQYRNSFCMCVCVSLVFLCFVLLSLGYTVIVYLENLLNTFTLIKNDYFG